MLVAWSKNWKYINKVPTEVWCFFIAFLLIILQDFQSGTFKLWNIVPHILSAVAVVFTTGKMADMNEKKSYEIIEEVKEPIGFKVGDVDDTTK
jgi:hypothetical protein